jgi:hypothetical protein
VRALHDRTEHAEEDRLTWVRLDDGFDEHEKVEGLSDAAFRLYIRALCWSSRQETDGKVPRRIAEKRGSKRATRELVEASLWDETGDDYMIRNYLEYNPSKAQLEAKRATTRERVSRHRNAVTGQFGNGVTSSVVTTAPAQPGPARPDPQPADAGSPARALEEAPDSTDADHESPIPMDLLRRAEERGVIGDLAEKLRIPRESVEDAAREFVGYWTIGKGTGQRRRHWMAKLREHVRQRHEQGKLRAPGEIRHTGMTPIEVGPGAMSPLVRQFLTGGGR